MTGYCVKCRETREIQNAEQVTMKTGRPATRGTCPVMQYRYVQDRQGFVVVSPRDGKFRPG